MNHPILKLLFLGCAALATSAYAHSDFHKRDRGSFHYDDYHSGWTTHSIQLEREALNRERERLHRQFDAQMRELDQRTREIDRWQSGHHHHHRKIARIANEKRDQLNRERERVNRERDRMNREFDQRNRELDQMHQQLSQNQNRKHYARHHHRERFFWQDNTCYKIEERRGREWLTRVERSACY